MSIEMFQTSLMYSLQTGIEMTTAATGAVYSKSLRLSNGARRNFTVGQIVNLITTDSQNIQNSLPQLNMVRSHEKKLNMLA